MFFAMSSFSTLVMSPRRFQLTNIRRNNVHVHFFPSKDGRVSAHVLARYAFNEDVFNGIQCLLYNNR